MRRPIGHHRYSHRLATPKRIVHHYVWYYPFLGLAYRVMVKDIRKEIHSARYPYYHRDHIRNLTQIGWVVCDKRLGYPDGI